MNEEDHLNRHRPDFYPAADAEQRLFKDACLNRITSCVYLSHTHPFDSVEGFSGIILDISCFFFEGVAHILQVALQQVSIASFAIICVQLLMPTGRGGVYNPN